MFRNYRVILIIFLFAYTPLFASYLDRERAVVVIAPVVDAVAKPLQLLDPTHSTEDLYAALPFSPEVGPNSCPRIHQFIYNEVGTCLEITQDGTEMLIEFPHLYHQNEQGNKQNQFWVPTKSVMPLKNLKEKVGTCGCIPAPINSDEPFRWDNPERFENILTLLLPWKDASTGITYSAGTRFKRAKHLDNESGYGIYLLSPSDCFIKIALVERDCALVDYPRDYAAAKRLFVKILKKWAALSPGKIAYVWGGCSVIETYKEEEFSRVPATRGADKLEYWVRPEALVPHGGLDCSGLVLRAAQIAGLPYFYKNTVTIGFNFKDLAQTDDLEEGDLILFKGHVMVVTDIKDNLFVEAVSYSSGYGSVHEIALGRAFENVTSYDDLCKCWKNKLPLSMKNKKGGLLKVIESFRLLSMKFA